MKDVELVIKIPGEIRKAIFDGVYCGISDKRVYDAIKNGVALPKGHGRLKDIDELLNMTESYKSELGRLKADPFVKCGIETVENFIEDILTIIEADKESGE